MLRALPALAVLIFLVPTSSQAQKRLAVVDVATPPSMLGLGRQVTRTILSSAESQGYVVTPPEQVLEKLGDKKYGELQACLGKPTCVTTKLTGLPVDRVVVGSLDRDDKNYLLKLWLVDLSKVEVMADVDRAILIASRRLTQDVNEAVPGLLRGEREARGTLKITASVKNARVTVDGSPAGIAPLSMELKPGKHVVRMEKRAYLAVDRFVDVNAGATTELEIRMIKEPGALAEEDELPTLAREQPKRQEEPSVQIPLGAYIAGGVAVVAGGAGVGFGVSARNAEKALEDGFDANRQVYTGTRADALRGKQNALVANVLYGASGAAAVTAVLLTLLADDGAPAPVSVAPSLTSSSAGLVIEGRLP